MEETIRILIIDDDGLMRETLKEVLEVEGYGVSAVATAREAILAARERFHHLFLIDIHLPDQSGIDLLHELKQEHPEAEAIMVTGFASLENALQVFESASAYIEKPVNIPELLLKIKHLVAKQTERIEQKRLQEKLQQELAFYRELSNKDPLTQLYNGRYFRHVLTEEIRRVRRYGRVFVVMMLDIDFFKQYNDEYGHVDADDALIELARIFRKGKRASDLVARLGGEEFAFLLPETGAEQAYGFAERARQQVAECLFPLRSAGHGRLTISIGIAEFSSDAEDATELLRRADQALYFAKRSGRNQTQVYGAHLAEN